MLKIPAALGTHPSDSNSVRHSPAWSRTPLRFCSATCGCARTASVGGIRVSALVRFPTETGLRRCARPAHRLLRPQSLDRELAKCWFLRRQCRPEPSLTYFMIMRLEANLVADARQRRVQYRDPQLLADASALDGSYKKSTDQASGRAVGAVHMNARHRRRGRRHRARLDRQSVYEACTNLK